MVYKKGFWVQKIFRICGWFDFVKGYWYTNVVIECASLWNINSNNKTRAIVIHKNVSQVFKMNVWNRFDFKHKSDFNFVLLRQILGL